MLTLSERPVLCECAEIFDSYHAAERIIALFLCKVKGCSFYVQFVTTVAHQMPIRAQYVVRKADNAIQQAPVVQKLDSTIHWINHHPTDMCSGNQLRLSSG